MQPNTVNQIQVLEEFGIVEKIHHPIIIIAGLPSARIHEIVVFATGEVGEVFVLEQYSIQVLIFSKRPVGVGTKVYSTGKFVTTPVGKELLGMIINPLGDPLSKRKVFKKPTQEREIDIGPLGIMERVKVKTPFLTGVAIIDMMIPLGKGQKELVIGDRKTGKSSFLLAAIKNQVHLGSIAIYAAIGKKQSDIKQIQEFFEREKIVDKTIMVATSSYDSPTLIYLTPYAAMTIAEYFRDLGIDTVVVMDDLSTHAKFYREISLLAKKFPGRESYPGDIFYTHARLLERTGNYKTNLNEQGQVSITTIPVVETVEGDFTGYISTNLMGMTDGHIFFDSNIYYRGRRPAVNVSLSVTRVGRQASSALLRSINREITAFLALYEKMQNLSHFGAELTETVKHVLRTGDMIYKFFEQNYNIVVPLQIQIILFSTLWLTIVDDISIDKITQYRQNLMNSYYNPDVQQFLREIIKVNTFNDLLGNINRNRDRIKLLCTTNTQ